eukprot:4282067-Prymnesium_polylepis.3
MPESRSLGAGYVVSARVEPMLAHINGSSGYGNRRSNRQSRLRPTACATPYLQEVQRRAPLSAARPLAALPVTREVR